MLFSTTLLLSHPATRRENNNVRRAAEAFRLGPRGRGPERRGRGVRAGARASALRRGACRQSASAPRLEEIKLARAARHRTRFAPLLHQRSLRPRRAHVRQVLSGSRTRPCARLRRTRPTSSPIRATRRKSPPCSTGPAAPTRPSRRSAADRACAAASSRMRNGHKGAVTIDLREMGKVKEVDKASRAALIEGGTYGPALEAQLRRMASRCAIFRRASNIRRSAAGSRRAAAAISRRSTPTSTISLNRCAR